MRLIDADMLKKYMMDNGKEAERFLEYIDEQPTAYDVNRVVEKLEALPVCSTWNHNSDNISRNAAVEIVKDGGKDE